MKTNKLWAAAGVLLFAFTLSCTNDQKKDQTPSKQGDSQNSQPEDTTISLFEADSIMDLSLLSKLYSFPVEKDSTVSFCGKLNNPQDKIRLRFTIYFSKQGKSPKKQAVFKIKGDDKFQFQFTAPAKGEMHLLIEEERAITWKNLETTVSEQMPAPDDCCVPPKKKKAAKRKSVGTQGGTGSGGGTDIYE